MKQLEKVQLQDAKELTPGQMKGITGGAAGYITCVASNSIGTLASGSYPDNSMTCQEMEAQQ